MTAADQVLALVTTGISAIRLQAITGSHAAGHPISKKQCPREFSQPANEVR
jgi:hypothetical protein